MLSSSHSFTQMAKPAAASTSGAPDNSVSLSSEAPLAEQVVSVGNRPGLPDMPNEILQLILDNLESRDLYAVSEAGGSPARMANYLIANRNDDRALSNYARQTGYTAELFDQIYTLEGWKEIPQIQKLADFKHVELFPLLFQQAYQDVLQSRQLSLVELEPVSLASLAVRARRTARAQIEGYWIKNALCEDAYAVGYNRAGEVGLFQKDPNTEKLRLSQNALQNTMQDAELTKQYPCGESVSFDKRHSTLTRVFADDNPAQRMLIDPISSDHHGSEAFAVCNGDQVLVCRYNREKDAFDKTLVQLEHIASQVCLTPPPHDLLVVTLEIPSNQGSQQLQFYRQQKGGDYKLVRTMKSPARAPEFTGRVLVGPDRNREGGRRQVLVRPSSSSNSDEAVHTFSLKTPFTPAVHPDGRHVLTLAEGKLHLHDTEQVDNAEIYSTDSAPTPLRAAESVQLDHAAPYSLKLENPFMVMARNRRFALVPKPKKTQGTTSHAGFAGSRWRWLTGCCPGFH